MLPQIETKVVEYKGKRQMVNGVAAMAKEGWTVATTTTVHKGHSCLFWILAIFTLGIFALIARGHDEFVVTFTRPVVEKA